MMSRRNAVNLSRTRALTIVGAIAALEPQDYIVTHYRDHGQAIARGLDPKRLMAELLGRSTGVSEGKGGSMHLADVAKGFWGGYGIVGGHIALATGLALAAGRVQPLHL